MGTPISKLISYIQDFDFQPTLDVTVVDTMQKVLAGEQVPQILLTPSVVVTPENLQDYLDGKLWTEPVAGFPEVDNGEPTVPE